MARELLVDFEVRATPEPRGSKQAFVIYADRKRKIPKRRPDGSIMLNVTDDNPASKAWQRAVADAARTHFVGAPAAECALEFEFEFSVYRPESHWGSGRNAHLLRDLAPARPIVRPDALKYARGTEDALTGIVWRDDAQVVRLVVEKRYAVPEAGWNGEGVRIRVWRSELQLAADLPIEQRARVVPARDGGDDPAQPSLLAA